MWSRQCSSRKATSKPTHHLATHPVPPALSQCGNAAPGRAPLKQRTMLPPLAVAGLTTAWAVALSGTSMVKALFYLSDGALMSGRSFYEMHELSLL
eukprot:1161126-Pelagomonas_calceolata.AAC.5